MLWCVRMKRSPFLPFLLLWAALVVAGFFLLRRYVPIADAWLGLISVNAATFVLYGVDKAVAGSGFSRVPERLLQLTALLGSPVGALAAMQVFRHKTRKQSFQLVLVLILLAQAVALALWAKSL